MGLTAKRQRFVLEYLVDLNATQAAIRAGYGKRGAETEGSRLLGNAEVAAAVAAGKAERAKRTQVEADEVLLALARILRADRRKLVEYRRTCCRHCWGKDYGYQRTKAELERDRELHVESGKKRERRLARQRKHGVELDDDDLAPYPAFDEKGGAGYDARKDPHPDCPECWGQGKTRMVIADTRKLDDDALAIYAGVRETKDGIEVMMEERSKAIDHLCRHLGIHKDKLVIEGDGIIRVETGVPASPEGKVK